MQTVNAKINRKRPTELLFNKTKRDILCLLLTFDREREAVLVFPAEDARETADEEREVFAPLLADELNPGFAFDELLRVVLERAEDEFPDFPEVEAIKSFFLFISFAAYGTFRDFLHDDYS